MSHNKNYRPLNPVVSLKPAAPASRQVAHLITKVQTTFVVTDEKGNAEPVSFTADIKDPTPQEFLALSQMIANKRAELLGMVNKPATPVANGAETPPQIPAPEGA